MITVHIDGRPDVRALKIKPPQPADRVIQAIATILKEDGGVLRADDELFVGNAEVPAGVYLFKAHCKGRSQSYLPRSCQQMLGSIRCDMLRTECCQCG